MPVLSLSKGLNWDLNHEFHESPENDKLNLGKSPISSKSFLKIVKIVKSSLPAGEERDLKNKLQNAKCKVKNGDLNILVLCPRYCPNLISWQKILDFLILIYDKCCKAR